METLPEAALARTGVDAVALKPTEHRLDLASDLPVDALAVDFEGRDAVPEPAVLRDLARTHSIRVTVPVRADGYDPLGDDSALAALPDEVGRILVAGNPAYLDDAERARAIAPRLRAAAEACDDHWVGTESVERVALAVGGTQFELLSAETQADVRGLRAAGVEVPIAVYAPTVLTDDPDAVLDALGGYVARRQSVRESLPGGTPTDSSAEGTARDVLLAAARDYALVGDPEGVAERVDSLRRAGVDHVVAYPARGLETVRDQGTGRR